MRETARDEPGDARMKGLSHALDALGLVMSDGTTILGKTGL